MGQDKSTNSKPVISWGGRKWWFKGDYYYDRRGRLLHRAIYAAAHGPIPRGIDIHHIDGDKTNNELSNLEAVTRSEHLKRHRPRGWVAGGYEAKRRAKYAEWAADEQGLVSRTCAECGKEFMAKTARAKFCSVQCNRQYQRKRAENQREWVCVECGKVFVASAFNNRQHRFCSQACVNRHTARTQNPQAARRRSEKECVICGKKFRASDPRTECCSRECGYKLKSNRAQGK